MHLIRSNKLKRFPAELFTVLHNYSSCIISLVLKRRNKNNGERKTDGKNRLFGTRI